MWAFQAMGHTPALPWQCAALRALRVAAGAEAGPAGGGGPLSADAVAAMLSEAGLAPVLAGALAPGAGCGCGAAAPLASFDSMGGFLYGLDLI